MVQPFIFRGPETDQPLAGDVFGSWRIKSSTCWPNTPEIHVNAAFNFQLHRCRRQFSALNDRICGRSNQPSLNCLKANNFRIDFCRILAKVLELLFSSLGIAGPDDRPPDPENSKNVDLNAAAAVSFLPAGSSQTVRLRIMIDLGEARGIPGGAKLRLQH